MPRLIETKEPRPEHSTVINWTVPVYIKNGEDYYKVCFDIKRKPLSDGTLPLTNEELEEFRAFYNLRERVILDVKCIENSIRVGVKYHDSEYVEDVKTSNIKAILYLAERFDLTGKK